MAAGIAVAAAAAVLAFSRRRGGEPVTDRAIEDAIYDLELGLAPAREVRE